MKITVEFSSWDELMEWKGSGRTIAVVSGLPQAAETVNEEKAEQEAPKAEQEAPKAEQKKAELPWEEPKKEEPKKEDPEKLRVTCRKILAKLNKAVGGNAAKKLIAEVDPDAENLRTVAADKLPELLKKAEEALNDAG